MGEVYAKTPIGCQLECVQPGPESFVYTRNVAPPRAMPDRDPCNKQEDAKKPQPSAHSITVRHALVCEQRAYGLLAPVCADCLCAFACVEQQAQLVSSIWPCAENIWPKLQTEATQPSFRPPRSNIANGDLRADPFITTYSTQFDAPFDYMKKIRSPMRNPDLAHVQELHPLYLSSFNRVTECALQAVQTRLHPIAWPRHCSSPFSCRYFDGSVSQDRLPQAATCLAPDVACALRCVADCRNTPTHLKGICCAGSG